MRKVKTTADPTCIKSQIYFEIALISKSVLCIYSTPLPQVGYDKVSF